jgi:3-carboxy-cis,cis-muconate cycloisomerase
MRLIDALGVTDEFAEIFSDASVLGAMLEFEVALARAQATLGIIPGSAARAIEQAAASLEGFDAGVLAREARKHATIAIPFVKAFTSRVRTIDESSAGFVHWGGTSQDVIDTALILLLRRARTILERDHERLRSALRQLSDRHANTVMLARTLLQPAPPITFGYKAAGWLGAAARCWRRLAGSFNDGLELQFGGASGTLAAHGDKGPMLAAELGRELKLRVPAAPWHAHRDRLGAVVSDCGLYTASLGKIARDLSLLMQFEVGEVSEAGGGSSAMPHKRNPAGSTIALAAATRVPGLVSAYLSGMVQEHERAAGGMQAEWQTIAGVVEATGSALSGIVSAIDGLTVNAARMRVNIANTKGAIYSEKAVMWLAESHGRAGATELVAKAIASGMPLREALATLLIPEQIETIDKPEDYLGSSEIFRLQLLAEEDAQ